MRILFLLQPGTNSRSIFLGMIRGAQAAGHEPLVIELAPIFQAMAQHPTQRANIATQAAASLKAHVARHRPDLSIAMWANGLTSFAGVSLDGQTLSIFDALKLPHICWWLDGPQWAAGGSIHTFFSTPAIRTPLVRHLINSESSAAEMTQVLGFGRTAALPYAIDEHVMKPARAAAPSFDLIASCGPGDPAPTPAVLRELDNDQPDIEAIRREYATNARLKLTALRPIAPPPAPQISQDAWLALVDALIAGQLAARATPVLGRVRALAPAHPAAASLLHTPTLYAKASMTLREIEGFERAFTISWLSRRFRVATFGGWDAAPWHSRAENLGELPFEDMPKAYGQAAAALNVMRWQDDHGINIKPFEITASATPCLCAARVGLAQCFTPGEEVITFEGPQAAAHALRDLLDSPTKREAIAAQGLARTLRDHTWKSRIATVLK
ncbi:MAG: glycosyltransferase [Phycisphaerales bacterium]